MFRPKLCMTLTRLINCKLATKHENLCERYQFYKIISPNMTNSLSKPFLNAIVPIFHLFGIYSFIRTCTSTHSVVRISAIHCMRNCLFD